MALDICQMSLWGKTAPMWELPEQSKGESNGVVRGQVLQAKGRASAKALRRWDKLVVWKNGKKSRWLDGWGLKVESKKWWGTPSCRLLETALKGLEFEEQEKPLVRAGKGSELTEILKRSLWPLWGRRILEGRMEAMEPLIDAQATRGDAGARDCGDGDGNRDAQRSPDRG